MAHISINLFSISLNRPVDFKIYLPNDPRPGMPENEYSKRPTKTLFILHGFTGDAYNWVPEELAQKYNFAIVMISGENAFYLDGLSSTCKYESFLANDVVNYVRKTFGLAKTPEDTYIMGFSMGGFGALHTAFKHPDVFGKLAALSSALIIHGIAHMKPGTDNGVANYDYYHECFGDLETVEERDVNPEVVVKKLKDEGKKIPQILMACGTEDFLLEPNRQFHKFLEDNKIEHTYLESKGQHDFVFWNEYTAKYIEEMFK